MAPKRVLIVGGGLAGLTASLHLQQAGLHCTLVEKNTYPFHRVCGEYVSNEVIPYLKSLGAYPEFLNPAQINRFRLTSVNGQRADLALDLGGFGVSRYAFDHFLFQLAQKHGVRTLPQTEVMQIQLDRDVFHVTTTRESIEADIVIGAYGKRSRIDNTLSRAFVSRHSPYVGVKYHLRLPGLPHDLISLHNFSGGYCGISHVEHEVVNLCYLTHRSNVRTYKNLPDMEKAILYRNPFLKEIFENSTFLFDKPETVNEISFEAKSPIDGHVLMCGDAAGMITPLCGNGMAMAIHSAKILSEHVIRYNAQPGYSRAQLELDYAHAWRRQFAFRLRAGRTIQHLFGGEWASRLAVSMASHLQPLAYRLMKLTHGQPF